MPRQLQLPEGSLVKKVQPKGCFLGQDSDDDSYYIGRTIA